MFPDPDKVHRASDINDFFTSFVNVCLPHILPMPKGIDYRLNLYAKNLHKQKLPSTDANEDQCSTTIVFRVVPLLT
jgi:hypothetical protein